MVYADDVTHVVTEEGIANLLLCRDPDEREQALRGVAGYTDLGRHRDRKKVERLHERGVIRRPEDLGIDPLDADRSLLAARSIKDLVLGLGWALPSSRQVSELVTGSRDGENDLSADGACMPPGGTRRQAIVGVVASGNLEVLVERTLPAEVCSVEIATSVRGFGRRLGSGCHGFRGAAPGGRLAHCHQRFRRAARHGGAAAGAGRAADMRGRRLMPGSTRTLGMSWYEATARQRVAALADPGTFVELIGPEQRETSPHLADLRPA